MFIVASSVCRSLQYLISNLTQGGEGGHLFRLTCSAALWGGRDTANTAGVCGSAHSGWVALGLPQPKVACTSQVHTVHVQGPLQGHSSMWTLCFMHFLALSHLGSQVLCKGTDPDGLCILCLSWVHAARVTWCFPSAQSQVAMCLCTSLVPTFQFPVCVTHSPSCAVCLLWGAEAVLLLADVNHPRS